MLYRIELGSFGVDEPNLAAASTRSCLTTWNCEAASNYLPLCALWVPDAANLSSQSGSIRQSPPLVRSQRNLNTVNPVHMVAGSFASHCSLSRSRGQTRMYISIERRIDELCDLAAREHDYTKLKNVIEQLLECIDARQQQREGSTKISFSGGGQNENSC
jgi:hypothetical protein